MTLTIELAPPEETCIRARAASAGLPVEEWVRAILREAAGEHVAAAGAHFSRRLTARELLTAPAAVREAALREAAAVAATYYGTPEGQAELADWRALDGEPFHEDGAHD